MKPISRIGIVGASAAGIAAALELRRCGFEGSITVFDSDSRTPYERPPLSKSLGRGTEELLVPIAPADAYTDNAIDLALGIVVTDLDPGSRHIVAGGEKFGFDRMLLASGARARKLGCGSPAENLLELRSADDAIAISDRLAPGTRLAVIGGGFVGLEVASAAAAIGAVVTVVEASTRPCSASLDERMTSRLVSLHRSRGIDVRLSTVVDCLTGSGTVDGLVLANGERLETDLVVVGIGVTPNTRLAAAIGLEVRGGIVVDHTGATRNPWIFAAGDVAVQPPHRHHRAGGRIEHWDNARSHGAVAARSMLGLDAEHVAVPFFWSDQHGHTLQMFGRPMPSDELIFHGSAQASGFKAFWIRDRRMVAAAALTEGPVLAGARSLIELDLPIDPRQLLDQDVNLRDLARAARRRMARA